MKGNRSTQGSFACFCLFTLSLGLEAAPPVRPADLPSLLSEVHVVLAEISWDFGDVAPPDWRRELTSSDASASFRFRWRHTGPDVEEAALSISNSDGQILGEVPLPLGPVFGDGFRYTSLIIGDLPGEPTLTMRVVVKDQDGSPLGSLSNSVQLTRADLPDPYLYLPLALLGIQEDTAVPGLSGSVWCGTTREERTWSSGNRRFTGGAGNVSNNDLWHIGSNTKAVTCTLLARLIQSETLLPDSDRSVDWDTRLVRVFPLWADDMDERIAQLTIRHLACHRSGLRMTAEENSETRRLGPGTLNEDPRAGRSEMSRRLLTRSHFDGNGNRTMPGTRWFYGSGNYLILGAVIEVLTGLSYETAMRELLFEPLGITTARFAMPADVSPYQPHGHRRLTLFPHETVVDNYGMEPVWNPAGGLMMSLADNLRFCRLHISGREGRLQLSSTTLDELHTPHPREFSTPPPEGVEDPSYGWGWIIRSSSDETGKLRLTHDGTYFRFYARQSVFPEDNLAVVTATNIGAGYGYGDRAVNLLDRHLIDRTVGKISDPANMPGTLSAGSRGSLGTTTWPDLSEDVRFDLRTELPVPPPSFTLAGFSLMSPLAAHDTYARTLAAYQRRPRLLAVDPLFTDKLVLQFASEEGFRYSLFRRNDFRDRDWTFLQTIVGRAGASSVLVDRLPEASTEIYQVRNRQP